jgi:hypothetical protein
MTLAHDGNFGFSLSDHAQNGFCNPLEWLPLISAFAVGFLLVLFLVRPTIVFLKLCASVLAVRALVGLIGFALHADTIRRQPSATLFERISVAPLPRIRQPARDIPHY